MGKNKPDVYSPENLMLYHIAIAIADKLEKDKIVNAKEKAKLYTIIGKEYGINSGSIFVA